MNNSITPFDCWLNRTNGGQNLERDLSTCDHCNALFYDKSGNGICDDCNDCRCEMDGCNRFTNGKSPLCDGCLKDLDPVDLIHMGYLNGEQNEKV